MQVQSSVSQLKGTIFQEERRGNCTGTLKAQPPQGPESPQTTSCEYLLSTHCAPSPAGSPPMGRRSPPWVPSTGSASALHARGRDSRGARGRQELHVPRYTGHRCNAHSAPCYGSLSSNSPGQERLMGPNRQTPNQIQGVVSSPREPRPAALHTPGPEWPHGSILPTTASSGRDRCRATPWNRTPPYLGRPRGCVPSPAPAWPRALTPSAMSGTSHTGEKDGKDHPR